MPLPGLAAPRIGVGLSYIRAGGRSGKVQLQAVAEGEPPVGFGGPAGGGGGAVSVEHRPGPPATERHQVAFGAAGRAELVRPGVPEHVRMQARDAGHRGAALEHPFDPVS